MIKINLLPKELRPVDRTPVPRLLLIFLTTAAGAGLLALVAYLILVDVKSKNTELAEHKKILRSFDEQVKQYDMREAELKAKIAKTADIERIAGRDVPWWQVIDALWTVVSVEGRRVWLEDIRVLDERGVQTIERKSDPMAKQFPAYGLQVRCSAAGFDAQEITRFRMDIKKHPLLRKYLPRMNFNPDYRLADEKDFVDGVSMGFELLMTAELPKAAGARK